MIFIGISGVTCGGKTTLCDKLLKKYQKLKIFHQDVYFLEPDDPRLNIIPELNHANWEELNSLDMAKMKEDIDEFRTNATSHGLIIIEGFTIFNYRKFDGMFTKKYFFTLNKEETWNRRKYRDYIPPDVPGYFDKVVWPMYEKQLEELKQQTDIDWIDGTDDQDDIFNNVCSTIEDLLQQ
ncbi:unnamed protein product [Owenia fusiformis]|uniref:Uncharacterized protein n=1 Tax=Owenia fusiformis TaxID=6347 RepID=A0A8J1TWN6_OWEFU|nr:unnamed protein product [Owenia fusiformis]